MDKIKLYEQKIISLLTPFEHKDRGIYQIVDTQNHHYQILRADWDTKNRYYFRVRIHVHINADGKIWVMENQVEEDIAEMLVEQGVPKSDIVLALLPERMRQHSGYAVS